MPIAQCQCGNICFTVSAEPLNVRACHCRMCQKATGAPFFARALFRSEDVAMTGTPGRYPSSDRQDRMFCSDCGTHIGAISRDESHIVIGLALFENRNQYTPTDHIWLSEKVDWVRVPDGVRRHDAGAGNRE